MKFWKRLGLDAESREVIRWTAADLHERVVNSVTVADCVNPWLHSYDDGHVPRWLKVQREEYDRVHRPTP